MEGCVFCDLTPGPREVVLYKNDNVYVRLDNFPVTFGHVEVIPLVHYPSVKDLTKEVWCDIYDGIINAKKILADSERMLTYYKNLLPNAVNQESAEFLKKALESEFIHKKIDGYTIGFNDGVAAGQSVMHCHLHIIPRYFGDVAEARGGIRGIFGESNY